MSGFSRVSVYGGMRFTLAPRLKTLLTVTSIGLLSWAPSDFAEPGEIFVSATAVPGGDGSSPQRAYRTIREAVSDANARLDGAVIRIAEGTYVETPNVTITRDHVALLGSTVLMRDDSNLPNGDFTDGAIVRPAVSPGTPVPVGSALLRVNASHVTIAGLVLDGGLPRPPLSIGGGHLLAVDGAPLRRSLDDISIRDNVVVDHGQAMLVRLASASISGNFFARSNMGLVAFAGFEQNAIHPEAEGRLIVTGNRFTRHQNAGLSINGAVGSLTAPAFASLGLVAAPSVQHIEITGNDISQNGNGPLYPQANQYSGVLFTLTNSDASDSLQPARIDALVEANRFIENGYGLSVSQRVGIAANQAAYVFDGRFVANTYCGNGLNDALFNFSLNAQTHGVTSGAAFRYAPNSTYVVDASADSLGADAFDYDHPLVDPRLPLTSPGTLVLHNVLTVNGTVIPNGVHITKPAVVSPGPPVVFAPIDVGVTPTVSVSGPNPMVIDRGDTFVDPGATASDLCEGTLTDKVVATGSVDVTTPGTYTVSYDVTNAVGKRAATAVRTVTVLNSKRLTRLGPAQIWMGLKDAGAAFDLQAVVYKNAQPIASGRLPRASGGDGNGSVNHAVLQEIPLQLIGSVSFRPGDTLTLVLSVRISDTSRLHNAVVRLWCDGPEADSRFAATLDDVTMTYYLHANGTLGARSGSASGQEISIALKGTGGLYQPLGAWKVIVNP